MISPLPQKYRLQYPGLLDKQCGPLRLSSTHISSKEKLGSSWLFPSLSYLFPLALSELLLTKGYKA